MTDYEYILQQARKFHFTKWTDEELRKCVDMLPKLSRQELTSLYYSRWVKEDKVFSESVFNTLFKDKVGKREERIKNMPTDELIAEFQDKKSGNVSLIRKEMRDRYKAGKDNTEQLLRKLHLINEENGLLTMAALLLFGKDVERWNLSVAFRIGRFGYSDADLILQDRIVCPLIMMPDMIIDTLRTKYLVSPIHYEGLRRKEPLEIPEDALREMVCNSIVHKNYTGTFTQMRVYGDSITLWNDGTLPANYTIKTLFKRHESRPRNKLIANVFYLAGFIEAWGRGYEKIRDAFKAENLEMPVFEEVRGGFMATVKREKFVAIQGRKDVAKDVIKDVTKDVIKEISDRQLVVYGLIKENPFVTIAEMSQKTGVASRTIIRDLEYLQSRGMLVREGGRKEGHWIIIGEI